MSAPAPPPWSRLRGLVGRYRAWAALALVCLLVVCFCWCAGVAAFRLVDGV